MAFDSGGVIDRVAEGWRRALGPAPPAESGFALGPRADLGDGSFYFGNGAGATSGFGLSAWGAPGADGFGPIRPLPSPAELLAKFASRSSLDLPRQGLPAPWAVKPPAPGGGSGGYGDGAGETALEQAIDDASADPRVRQAMRMAVLLEGGNFEGGWGVGDTDLEGSYGPYQINYQVHKSRISKEQALDPVAATRYMLPEFQAAVERVPAALWRDDPSQAAALAAYYAERPAQMYASPRVQWAAGELTRRQARRAAPVTAAAPASVWSWTGGQRYALTTDYDEVDPRFYQGNNNRHMGLDLATPAGTAVTAPIQGKVLVAGPQGGYGNLVVIDTGSHHVYLGHLGEIAVRPGQTVGAGTLLARTGNSGVSTGPHLHFEVRDYQGRYVDPRRHYRLD